MAAAKTQTPKLIAETASSQIPKRAVPLSANSFKLAEYARSSFVATIPANITQEDILEPSFWAHVASSMQTQLRPTDRIECVWEDFSQYAEILVIRPTKVSATVAMLWSVDLRAGNADIDMGAELANYLIRFAGPTVGYRVIYKPDNSVLKDQGLATESMAKQWLIAHLTDATKNRASVVGAAPGPVSTPSEAA